MKILDVTGGSTKFIQLATGMILLNEVGYKPTDLVVMSASAIASLPFVLSLHNNLIEEGISLNLKKIFKQSPTTKKGGLSLIAAIRVFSSFFTDIHSLGRQDTSQLIKKYVSEDLFNFYRANEDLPNIHVITVWQKDGKPRIYNLKDLNYKEAIDCIMASSRIPVMVQSQFFDNKHQVDGGAFLGAGAGYFIEEGYFDINKISKCISLYAWTNPYVHENDNFNDNVLSNTFRTIDILDSSKRWHSVRHMYWMFKAHNKPLLQLHVPDVLDQLYDVDIPQLIDAHEKTKMKLEDSIKNFDFS